MSRHGGCAGLILGTLGLFASGAPASAQWCDEPDIVGNPAILPSIAEIFEAPGSFATSPTVAATAPSMPRLADDDTRVSDFEAAALSRGTPDIPGLNIVWLVPWIDPALARDWTSIIVHQSEGGAGSAWRNAVSQMQRPDRRGATIWIDTDGAVIWSVAEFAAPGHTVSNRNDNRFVDNTATFKQVTNRNALGIEFVGNYPNVRRKATDAQIRAWRILVRVLEVRYGIPRERVFAHNWVSYRDRRYCEGCELADIARTPPPDTPLLLATHP